MCILTLLLAILFILIKLTADTLDVVEFPPNVPHPKVRDGKLKLDAHELAKDAVVSIVEDYNYAVKHNYMISGVFIR